MYSQLTVLFTDSNLCCIYRNWWPFQAHIDLHWWKISSHISSVLQTFNIIIPVEANSFLLIDLDGYHSD